MSIAGTCRGVCVISLLLVRAVHSNMLDRRVFRYALVKKEFAVLLILDWDALTLCTSGEYGMSAMSKAVTVRVKKEEGVESLKQ